ncbi:ATP-binding protein [cf. Phormidesmis sp. LEGE 11477]|uniref:sensor histidine kinase n=1 Tax=cf. Phormidesmis sp. LEGE 11477 TaxID=1828680 RepID=UPI0018821295|nr:hybrid sensor histidine kinase/response regulator [cf. Phormidesmis sp. LEGE 11477]MBE9063713.1 response regulator [cf. Phormidesmis sp. LEGE 11477]
MALEKPLQRILLIDDDPNDRLLAIREVNREFPDVEILEALNWQQIHQSFAADEFDLVITDYELNWATGLEVLQALKAHDDQRPIIMFTDSGSQEIAVKAMKAGLDDYVLKSPKHLVRLAQAVRSVWENAQVRRRASELEFRLQFLLNELAVGVFRTTLEGELIEASDGLLELLHLNSLAAAQSFFQQNLAASFHKLPTQNRWHREVKIVRAKAKILWLRISETKVRINGNWVIDGLVHNVTAHKETEATLEALNQTLEQRVVERTARLEQLNQELEMFAFAISHDLRAPIRQISGFVAFLKQSIEPVTSDKAVLRYLRQIVNLTGQAGRMIDDLLQYSSTGRAELQYVTVDMEKLVKEVKQQIEVQTTDRTIHWRISSLPTLTGDRTLLSRVWQNLLENAVKYTQNKAQAKIEIDYRTGQNEQGKLSHIFSVRDNGIGFEQKEHARLFGVFQRLHSEREFAGTGIGLASTKRAIYRHKGSVWAEGKAEAGAVFYFSLPYSIE